MTCMSSARRRLKRLGKVRGIVERSLILEGEMIPELGEKVYDSKLSEVGRVLSVFGPTNRFFIEVSLSRDARYEEGTPLYILEEKRGRRDTRRSSR